MNAIEILYDKHLYMHIKKTIWYLIIVQKHAKITCDFAFVYRFKLELGSEVFMIEAHNTQNISNSIVC